MRVLFCGDVVGKAGRRVVLESVPRLRRELDLDFVIVNGENAAHGFGITERICRSFHASGVDVITTGNHVWDRREIVGYIADDGRLLRPLNHPESTPGPGSGAYKDRNGRRVVVIHPMGRLFMSSLDNPFTAVRNVLKNESLGKTADFIFVDFHAEATSEKTAMGHYLDGQVSAVVGTHTHVPSADARILPGGTAYQTDAGMCGDYNSVIGMGKDVAVARFAESAPKGRLEPAGGDGTLCAVFIESDDETGLAKRISPVRLGAQLIERLP